MSNAERIAHGIVSRLGRDPWKVAHAEGIEVHHLPFPRGYREMYLNDPTTGPAIAIADDAREPEARELLAHGLGHHFLHVGNRMTSIPLNSMTRREREAEEFAAVLLIDFQAILSSDVHSQRDAWRLAQHVSVSEGLARTRLSLLQQR